MNSCQSSGWLKRSTKVLSRYSGVWCIKSNSVITITIILNSRLYGPCFDPKWSLYYINVHNYNKSMVITNKCWRSCDIHYNQVRLYQSFSMFCETDSCEWKIRDTRVDNFFHTQKKLKLKGRSWRGRFTPTSLSLSLFFPD